MDLWEYEKKLYKEGIEFVGGVDEVGRGPLVGNVVAACCVLPKDFVLDGLTDSKKLTEKKREKYFDYIKDNCIAYGIGECSPKEIDELNILEATKLAMKRAVDIVKSKINLQYILIDGNMKFDFDNYESIVKGDSKSISIAAASVLAKVTRDRQMYELDKKYKEYGFASHKGYPTKKHIEAINKYGLIDGYRKTYSPVMEVLNKEVNK